LTQSICLAAGALTRSNFAGFQIKFGMMIHISNIEARCCGRWPPLLIR
jgi:hypothetical protein